MSRSNNLSNYNVITDCASANVKAISKMTNNGDPVEHAICGAHSLNNAFKMGIEKCTDQRMNNFITDIKSLINKATRRHLNQKFQFLENWRKLVGSCDTRWGTLVNSIKSLESNYDILLSHQNELNFDFPEIFHRNHTSLPLVIIYHWY